MLQAAFLDKLPEIIALFKENKVARAYAFGSVCTDEFNEESDVDLLIAFEEGLDPIEYGDYYWNLDEELPRILNREVDLVTEPSLRNRYFIERINATKIPLYEA
jgi:hypothetical protein